MNKLRLDPELLRVESFTPGALSAQGAGTVRAHVFVTSNNPPCNSNDCMPTEYDYDSCGHSCLNKCVQTIGQLTCEIC